MALIAAMLLQRFKLQWPAGDAWPAGDLGVTLRPATPIGLYLQPRNPL